MSRCSRSRGQLATTRPQGLPPLLPPLRPFLLRRARGETILAETRRQLLHDAITSNLFTPGRMTECAALPGEDRADQFSRFRPRHALLVTDPVRVTSGLDGLQLPLVRAHPRPYE